MMPKVGCFPAPSKCPHKRMFHFSHQVAPAKASQGQVTKQATFANVRPTFIFWSSLGEFILTHLPVSLPLPMDAGIAG